MDRGVLPRHELAISEYNWGSDDGISGALAQAEALAIFAREGVDLATRWVAPAVNSKIEDAFLLYRNYDGAGAQVSGDSVRATSANVDAVGAYAVRGGAREHALRPPLQQGHDDPDGGRRRRGGAAAGRASFSAATRLAAAEADTGGGALTLDLPARSATLAVVPLPASPPPARRTSFHPRPCRALDTRNANGALGGPLSSRESGATPRSPAPAGFRRRQCPSRRTSR